VWHQDRCGEISYDRAIELLKDVISYMSCDDEDKFVTRNLGYAGFEEDELYELGFGYLLEEE
jgi:hypothetical protein